MGSLSMTEKGFGYEMGSLSMIKKGFEYEMGSVIRTNFKAFFCLSYECVMKNELEFVLCRENVVYFD